ncbi:MAG: YdcF family protein [Rhodospirillales bacterium]
MVRHRHANRRLRGGSVVGLVVLCLVALGIWAGGLFLFAETLPDRVEDSTTPTGVVVVLTGGSGRLEAGLDVLAAGMAEHLYVSGVFPGVDVQRLLELASRDPGALEGRISIGDAENTIGNAAETAAWTKARGYASLRLVTSAYHMPRSLLEFREALPAVRIIPHPVFSETVKQDRWWAWPGTAALIIGEYNKFLAAWTAHWLQRFVALMKPENR